MSRPCENESARPVPGPMDACGARRYVVEISPRRVRVMLGGEFVADSTRVRLLFETGKLPVYYFPRSDVAPGRLSESARAQTDDVKGERRFFHVAAGGREARDAAWSCAGNSTAGPDIGDLIAFDWNAMSAWFEEDEQVFVHPRDPYTRVDVVESSREVKVGIDGVLVAHTRRPMMLFETGLPTRYYIPKMDVQLHRLEPSDSHTACPYKGTADYFGVRSDAGIVEDIVWCYERPIPEIPKIAGRLCFYNERVDLEIDGELQKRPITKWS